MGGGRLPLAQRADRVLAHRMRPPPQEGGGANGAGRKTVIAAAAKRPPPSLCSGNLTGGISTAKKNNVDIDRQI